MYIEDNWLHCHNRLMTCFKTLLSLITPKANNFFKANMLALSYGNIIWEGKLITITYCHGNGGRHSGVVASKHVVQHTD